MNKLLFTLIVALLAGCAQNRQDGVYQAADGWDIVEGGKTYEYRCESDGLYLYINWDGQKQYSIGFKYKSPIYRHTVGHEDNQSSTILNFLCKNKDGNYVYVANYSDFDGNFYNLQDVEFQTDNGITVIYPYKHMKQYFSLFEKYVK